MQPWLLGYRSNPGDLESWDDTPPGLAGSVPCCSDQPQMCATARRRSVLDPNGQRQSEAVRAVEPGCESVSGLAKCFQPLAAREESQRQTRRRNAWIRDRWMVGGETNMVKQTEEKNLFDVARLPVVAFLLPESCKCSW